jgi:PAS domain S-box-containing protein
LHAGEVSNGVDREHRANGALARGILDSVVVGVVEFNRARRAVYANAYARQMLAATGFDPDRCSLDDFQPFTIWPDGSICRPEDYPAARCFETGLPQGPTTIGVRQPGGEVIWATISVVPAPDSASGRPETVVATFVDVSRWHQVEESLRQSEDRYRRLVEEAPDAIVVHQDSKIVFINDAGMRLWAGTTRQQFLGRSIFDFVDPRFHDVVKNRVREVHRGATAPPIDQVHVRLDGRKVRVEVTGMPCVYDGQPCVQAILRDVTRRRRVERQVRRQREILRKFFDRIPVLVAMFDPRGRARVVNRQWKRVMGCGAGVTIRQLLERFYPDALERQRVVHYMEAGGSSWRDLRIPTRDGRVLDISWARIVLSDGTQVAIGQDVTERNEAAAELRRHRAELEQRVRQRTDELLRKNEELQAEIAVRRAAEAQLHEKQHTLEQMLDTHERYRQLVAYEIHDAFVQDVIGALMHLDLFHDKSAESGLGGLEPIEHAQSALRRAIRAARRMVSGLRPPIIDEQGVVSAIEYLVSELVAGGMDIRLEHDVRVRRMAPVLEAAVFRIVQEALTNVERHSKSHFAQLNLTQMGGMLRVEIRDFGVGFDPIRVGQGHFGLQGIQERARLCGGTAKVTSQPGKGTTVLVDIPIEPAEAPATGKASTTDPA